MVFLSLAAAIATTFTGEFVPEPVVSVPTPPPPVLVTGSASTYYPPDTFGRIELQHAGQLIFNPNASDYPVALLVDEKYHYASLLIGFDAKGAFVSCKPASATDTSAFAARSCDAMSHSASFKYVPGFVLAAKVGYLSVSVTAGKRLPIATPIQFVPRGKGEAVSFYYTPPRRVGGHKRCEALQHDIDRATRYALCDAYLKTDSARNGLFSDGLPIASDGQYILTWVKKSAAATNEGYVIEAGPRVPSFRTYPIYQPLEFPSPLRPKADEGTPEFDLSSVDEPEESAWHHWKGTVVTLIGIDPIGRIVSCRLTETSGSSGLDNATCAALLKSGRYKFDNKSKKRTKTTYELIHYTWE